MVLEHHYYFAVLLEQCTQSCSEFFFPHPFDFFACDVDLFVRSGLSSVEKPRDFNSVIKMKDEFLHVMVMYNRRG